MGVKQGKKREKTSLSMPYYNLGKTSRYTVGGTEEKGREGGGWGSCKPH